MNTLNKEPSLLIKQYKDHEVANAVNNIEEENLPANARIVHTQPIRHLSVTIQVIDDKTDTVIETVSGKSNGGSISIDSESLIRRRGSLDFIYDDTLYPSPNALMWFGNKIRIYAGLKDMRKIDHVVNFCLGTFWIDSGGLDVSPEKSNIKISFHDKMGELEDVELENNIKIEPNTPIDVAMRKVMEDLGETRIAYIEESKENEVVPSTLEFSIGTTKIDVVKKLRDMYMDYKCGYNIMGEFEFKKFEVQKETEFQKPKWDFSSDVLDGYDLMLSYSDERSLKDIRNRISVIGGTNERTGLTPHGEVRITDSKNPFNIDAIGTRTRVIQEGSYFNDIQCESRARFEIWKTSNFQEKIQLEAVPIYFFDADDIIEVTHPKTKEKSRHVIDKIDIGLSHDSRMSIHAHKLYYTGIEYGEAFIPLVNAFVKGIKERGWLSLPEERIKDCFNMSGSGESTIIVRFVDIDYGGEQASITSYPTTKNQTLQIDLADFKTMDLNNENGAISDRSRADYADRVVGHEMFHAVCNDFLGHDAMVEVPPWFQEGFAEFVHGGKDRFNTFGLEMSQTNRRKALIELAKKQLDGDFEGNSEDYIAAYLIAIAIYNLSSKQQWKNMFVNLKGQKNIGINFLLKLLPIGATNDEVKEKVIKELNSMDKVWKMLFDKDDQDTGSVGGIHFMNLYGVPLTAESVFNNANAEVESLGFKIRIEK